MRKLFVLALVLLAACARRPPAPPDPLAGIRWDPTPLDWSRPLPVTPPGGLAEAGYVGAAACEPCHAKIAARYAGHSMALTGLRPLASLDQKRLARIFDAGASTPIRHPSSGYRYRPLRQGARYFVEETLAAPDGTVLSTWLQPVTHSLSAGRYGMAFYSRQGTRLYHVPLDYFARIDRWDLDPEASGGNPRFSNSIGGFCISCHSDYPLRRAGADDVFFDPLPAGVGCERCHGPGARHAESLAREDIVNPARLSRARQLDVCTQCHQSGAAALRAGQHDFSYRPGTPLDAHRVNFVADTVEPDRFRLLAHGERLAQSACFRGGKLVCTSCHDAHTSSFDQPPGHWDERCAACHAEGKRACSEPPARRGDGHCAGCHMRAGPTADQPLVTATDHFIQRRPPPIKPGPVEKPRRLVAWSTLLGEPLAGADLPAVQAAARGKAGRTDEALALLDRALAARAAVPQLYEWLAGQLDRRGQKDDVRRARAAVLRIAPDARTLLPYALGMLDAGTAEARAEAGRALERRLALDPDDPGALEVKGMLLLREGAVEQARPLLARAAALGPMAARAHVGLAALALREKRPRDALADLEAARRVEPRDAWILDRLAATYGALGEPARAAELARVRAALAASGKPPSITATSGWLPPPYR